MREPFLIATRTKNIDEHKAAQQYAFDHGFLWCGKFNKFEDYRNEYNENIWYCCAIDGYLYYCRSSYYKGTESYKNYRIVYVSSLTTLMETE